MALAER
jgi:hypothetical protein